ncbi:uncharacterized protein LOC144420798 [Styela clava]
MLHQEIIEKGLGWDEVITEDNVKEWDTWFNQLTELEYISIPRCFKPQEVVDENNQIHCSFLCGKAKVTPPRAESIPRLELVAAVLAVKADKWLRLKLGYSDCESVFWTDSSAVHQSICNPRKRFRTFVANRLAKIHRQSNPSQWRHVPSKINLADDASRGLSLKTLINKSRWLLAPEFLWKNEDSWPLICEDKTDLPDEFQPIERKKVATIIASNIDKMDNYIKSFSDLQRLKISTAWVLRYKGFLRNHNSVTTRNITVEVMQYAEQALVKYVQHQNYKSVIDNLSDKSEIGDRKARHEMKKAEHTKSIAKLDPIIPDGILRIGGGGGGLDKAPISFEMRHPIILPNDHHLTRLIFDFYHKKVGHSSVSHTWNVIREKYWITRPRATIRHELNKCVTCRKANTRQGEQLMAELPSARLKVGQPPFYSTGIDFFGPYLIKRGRSEIKRYGCIFTCLTTRAVHIELAEVLSTDAFINALRRFMARRSKPFELHSDNGSNFVGAQRILREEI